MVGITSILVVLFVLGTTPALAATLVNDTINVPALSYYSYYFNTQADNPTLTIDINAPNDISVYVMDETNFQT